MSAQIRESILCPDAREALNYRQIPFQAALDGGVVAVDTNVLLLPYRLSQSTFARFEVGLRGLAAKKRLFIPAHCAREYALHRPVAVGELLKAVSDYRSRLAPVAVLSGPALERLPEYQAMRKSHGEVVEALALHSRHVEEVASRLLQWNQDDPFCNLYAECFPAPAIIAPSLGDDAMLEDAARRANIRQPPGYKDRAKEMNSYGDVVIWHSILELGRQAKTHVVFVTADEKGDWFHQSNGQALMPRVELLLEFSNHTGGKHLVVVPPSKLLQALGAEITAVAEVERLETMKSNANAPTADVLGTRGQYLAAITNTEAAEVGTGGILCKGPSPLDVLLLTETPNGKKTEGIMLWHGANVPDHVGVALERVKALHNIDSVRLCCMGRCGDGSGMAFHYTRGTWKFPSIKLEYLDTAELAYRYEKRMQDLILSQSNPA
jgi:hypothetical protein